MQVKDDVKLEEMLLKDRKSICVQNACFDLSKGADSKCRGNGDLPEYYPAMVPGRD